MAKNIKLPLASFGFKYLCNYIKTLRQNLDSAAQKVDTNAAVIAALTDKVMIGGEVTTLLTSRAGTVIGTRSGTEISALRILS